MSRVTEAVFAWPGAIHEGHGEGLAIIDERASEAQREALLKILGGQETEPFATIFSVIAAMTEKFHPPLFQAIEFEADMEGRLVFDADPRSRALFEVRFFGLLQEFFLAQLEAEAE